MAFDRSTKEEGVTLAGTPDYITISGQAITRNQIVLTTDVSGILPVANGGTNLTSLSTLLNSNVTPTSLSLVIGTNVQAHDADTAKTDTIQAWTLPQRTALLTDDDGSFDLGAKQNFFCTPGEAKELTFANPADGQSGFVKLVNAGTYSHTAHANTKINSDDLSAIGAAGTFLLGYLSDGTNTWVTVSKSLLV